MDIFTTQLLMIRYSELLARIQRVFDIPDERMEILRERIVNAQWIRESTKVNT
jgi:hypothetical protein